MIRPLLVLVILIQFSAFAQIEKSKKHSVEFAVGASYTFIWDNENASGGGTHRYQEHTLNMNFATSFVNRWWIGMQALPIFTKQQLGLTTNRANYTIVGLFTQYDLLKKDRWKLYAEASINYGDYCTCGKNDPYRLGEISYLGFGGGAQFPLNFISKHLFLDLGFFNYIILPKIDFKYNYTQYVFGLNYLFGKID